MRAERESGLFGFFPDSFYVNALSDWWSGSTSAVLREVHHTE